MQIPAKILNNNGLKIKIPCIGMGTFGSDKFSPGQVAKAVKGAIEFGYRLFDCAAVYGNEDCIGKARPGGSLYGTKTAKSAAGPIDKIIK